MQCPKCSYVLTYSDRLLCRVTNAHFCPRCWSRIEDEEVALPVGAPTASHGKAKPNGSLDAGDGETHLRFA